VNIVKAIQHAAAEMRAARHTPMYVPQAEPAETVQS